METDEDRCRHVVLEINEWYSKRAKSLDGTNPLHSKFKLLKAREIKHGTLLPCEAIFLVGFSRFLRPSVAAIKRICWTLKIVPGISKDKTPITTGIFLIFKSYIYIMFSSRNLVKYFQYRGFWEERI